MTRPPLLLSAVLLAPFLPSLVSADPFVFVALPDTQIYAENRFPDGQIPAVTDARGTGAIFFDQTRWIVENQADLDIRYVCHLGDIVQDGNNLDEWELATDAMRLLLDADIPHGTVMGNHDDNHPPDYRQNYLDNFGPDVFAGRPWYTASSPEGGANFQLMEHEHYKIGFLNFSIDHPQAEIDWAHGIVLANPDTIFVIGTHRYLYDFKLAGGRYGEDVPTPIGDINLPQNPIGAVEEPNDAEELFDEFVSAHPNILMIHAGHFHADWLRTDGLNSAAQTIFQILTDYQNARNGGDGWLRIYELDFDANTFHFETYSPTLGEERSVMHHFVESIHLAYDQRDSVAEVLGVDVDQYLLILDLVFKLNPNVPDFFLNQHPDLDEPDEQAKFDAYLNDLFLGSPPPGFGNIHEWENLWMVAFAKDIDDPMNFEPASRSPSRTIEVDFSAYFTASPAQELAASFARLLAALAALDADVYTFPTTDTRLRKWVERARKLHDRGKTAKAGRVLARKVQRRIDGCALRGRPDASALSANPLRRWLSWDWLNTCEAQDAVYPHLQDTIARLEEQEAP